jgi:hypothetical protein
VSDDDSPSLGGNLDLSNNNIIGTGNINIDGTITATGSINLGDGVEDNIIVGGVIGSNLIPDTDGLYDLGSNDFYWRKGYFEDVAVDGELTANSLQVNSIELDDSTTIFQSDSKTFFGTFEGELIGSVFGDDSQLLVDGGNNSLNLSGMNLIDNNINLENEDGSVRIQSAKNERAIIKLSTDAADWSLQIDGLTDGNNSVGNLINVYRGTLSTVESVQPGDFIFRDVVLSWSGSDTVPSTAIVHSVDENATIQPDSVPGKLRMVTFTEDDITTAKGIVIDKDGQVSISHPVTNYNARQTLDVNGGAIFEESVEAASFIGSLVADNSNMLVDAINGEVLASIRDISVLGETGTPTSNPDTLSPVEWLTINVNGNIRYIPLYS